jgi:AraC family cel operon transcriptional repressor
MCAMTIRQRPRPARVAAPVRFRLRQFIRPADFYHFAVAEVGLPPGPVHRHDFLEVFWIMEGNGVHRINGQEMPARPGSLTFIRARDCHTFYAPSKTPLKIANVAFRPGVWNYLRWRYFPKNPDLFADKPALPLERALKPLESGRLMEAARELSDPKRSRYAIEKFLVNFAVAAQESGPGWLPDWLKTAVARLAEPVHFRAGTKALAQLAGRSPEHVAREVQRYFHCTPTDLVNGVRLQEAAQALSTTSTPILDVSLDCGFGNLSYFYKLFHARYGISPRRYRVQSRQILGQK